MVWRAECGAMAISSAQRFLQQVQPGVSSHRRLELVCGLSAEPELIKDGRRGTQGALWGWGLVPALPAAQLGSSSSLS